MRLFLWFSNTVEYSSYCVSEKEVEKFQKTVEKSFQLEANDEILTKLVQLLEGEIKKQETAAKLIS